VIQFCFGGVQASYFCVATPAGPIEMNFIKPIVETSSDFELERYFNGCSVAEGIFEDRFGNIRKCFTVVINGTVERDTLHLEENFEYDDGSVETRVWTIKICGQGEYEGRARDVIGIARGKVKGNSLHWSYRMRLPLGKRSLQVRFDDKMWLLADGKLLNRARVLKYGILVGSVTIVFSKIESAPEGLAASQSVGISRLAIAR
jgi:hypothetical protein